MSKVFEYAYSKVLDWHDGDTCHMDIDLGFGLRMNAYFLDGRVSWSARIWGINAPELKIHDAAGAYVDNPPGQASLAYAQLLCPPGSFVATTVHSWDREGGRLDVSITLPPLGADFAVGMVAAGHAVRYLP